MKSLSFFIIFSLAQCAWSQNIKINNYVLLPDSAEKRVFLPTEMFADEWAELDFDDSSWLTCSGAPGGVGYEAETGYEHLISLDVGDNMFGWGDDKASCCLVRIKFNMTDEQIFRLDSLFLKARYDDGFIAKINVERGAKINTPTRAGTPRSWNAFAEVSHESDEWEKFDIWSVKPILRNGENILAVQAFNDETTSPDFLINVQLEVKEFPELSFESSNVPLVFIDTGNKLIPNNEKIDAHMSVINHGAGQTHRVDEAVNGYDGKIGIEIRGNSSTSYPKKQYGIETRQEDGSNNNVSLMGLPTENDWVLSAPYIDKTFLRNVLTYDLSRRMGRYAGRTRYCELFLNGLYQGLYVLTEKPKRDNDRINISKMDSTAVDGDALTGGYIIKIDKLGNDGFFSHYKAKNGWDIRYQYHYPQDDKITPVQKAYIENWVHAFESMMAGDSFADPATGYPIWIDTDSFVDYFLLNEFAKNVDSYRLSTFFYKDRDSVDPRLKIGPVWDFNIAYGASHQFGGPQANGWVIDTLIDSTQTPFWWEKLRHDPNFNRRIKSRWQELRADVFDVERIFDFIDDVSDTLAQARERNFAIWSKPGQPCEGFWPVPDAMKELHTFEDEIKYLKDWIANRINWMDENVLLFTDVYAPNQRQHPAVFALQQNYPNPFNASTIISFELKLPGDVILDVYNSTGQLIRSFRQSMPAGEHDIVWDGRDNIRQPVAGGLYFYKFCVRSGQKSFTQSRKMLLLK